MEEESKKLPPLKPPPANNDPFKKPQPPQNSSEVTVVTSDDDVFCGLSIDDETTQQLSDLLEDEEPPLLLQTTTFPPFKVRFVSYPYVAPPFECSSSYITINGNEESCGSSFSDWESSIMASVDTRSVNITDRLTFRGVDGCGAWDSDDKAAREGVLKNVDGFLPVV